MKKITAIATLLVLLVSMTACEKRGRSVEFMPDMYYPTAYDPYQSAIGRTRVRIDTNTVGIFNKQKGMTALSPVQGVVARNEYGILPYDNPDNNEGYEASKAITTSVFTGSEKDIARGKKMFEMTCGACHGIKGDGKGPIVESGAYVGVPNYKDRDVTLGSVFHVITYGRNNMGSYASQLTVEDRWRVAEYVMQLKGN